MLYLDSFRRSTSGSSPPTNEAKTEVGAASKRGTVHMQRKHHFHFSLLITNNLAGGNM